MVDISLQMLTMQSGHAIKENIDVFLFACFYQCLDVLSLVLLKSTYNAKLKGLDAIMKKDNVMINYINSDAEIILKASIFDQLLYEAVKICREIPEADAMAEDTFIDDRNNFRWKDVLSTGLRVFIAGIDGATGVAQVSGGGGTSNDMPWRDKDEDFLDWARRAMRYAHAKHYPGNRLKQSLSK